MHIDQTQRVNRFRSTYSWAPPSPPRSGWGVDTSAAEPSAETFAGGLRRRRSAPLRLLRRPRDAVTNDFVRPRILLERARSLGQEAGAWVA
jgi:hypothetical protein